MVLLMAKVARGASRDIMSVDVGVTTTSTPQLTSRERSELQSGLRPETDFRICKTSDRPNTKYAYYSCLSTATVMYCVNQLQYPARPSKIFSSSHPSLFFKQPFWPLSTFKSECTAASSSPLNILLLSSFGPFKQRRCIWLLFGIDGAETYPIKRWLFIVNVDWVMPIVLYTSWLVLLHHPNSVWWIHSHDIRRGVKQLHGWPRQWFPK